MPRSSPKTEFDPQSSHMTENTPLLAESSSKALVERTRAPTTSICTDWRPSSSSQNRWAQSKGKASIRQKSPSSAYSLLSDSSDREDNVESSRHGRRTSSGFPSINRTSVPSSSITFEDGDETLKTHSGTGNSSHEPNLQAPHSAPASGPWFLYEGLIPSNVSLRLENSGSVARDHLASERTFLAYMRTSLAIAASGVALVQLFSATSSTAPENSMHRLHQYVQPLGASTIVIGLMVLFIGVMRYFTIQSALMKGYFPVARLATGFIATILTALVTLTFGVLIAGKLTPNAWET